MDADEIHAALDAQRAHNLLLAEEQAALRREAAEILSRSRWWREECRRELLRGRHWHRAPSPAPRADGGGSGPADS